MEKINYWINVIKAFSKALDIFKTEFQTLQNHDGKGTATTTENPPIVQVTSGD